MGEITRADAIKILSENNKSKRQDRIIMYIDFYIDYQIASANIREKGTICAHPKTGAPMENPYVKIRSQMTAEMMKLGLDSTGLW